MTCANMDFPTHMGIQFSTIFTPPDIKRTAFWDSILEKSYANKLVATTTDREKFKIKGSRRDYHEKLMIGDMNESSASLKILDEQYRLLEFVLESKIGHP